MENSLLTTRNPLAKIIKLTPDGRRLKGQKVGYDAIQAEWSGTQMILKEIPDALRSDMRLWVLQVKVTVDPYFIDGNKISPVSYFTIGMWTQRKVNNFWAALTYSYGLWDQDESLLRPLLGFNQVTGDLYLQECHQNFKVVIPLDRLYWTWTRKTIKNQFNTSPSYNFSLYFVARRGKDEKRLLIGFYYAGTGYTKLNKPFPVFKSTKGSLISKEYNYCLKELCQKDDDKEIIFQVEDAKTRKDSNEVSGDEEEKEEEEIHDQRLEPNCELDIAPLIEESKPDYADDEELGKHAVGSKKIKK